MADNIVQFPGLTAQKIDPLAVLDGAKEAELVDVLVLGWGQDGTLYAASSFDETGNDGLALKAMHVCEVFKHWALTDDDA